jgi:hypothetical protein
MLGFGWRDKMTFDQTPVGERESSKSTQSQEEYASLLKADPNYGVIEKYEGLEICEYQ